MKGKIFKIVILSIFFVIFLLNFSYSNEEEEETENNASLVILHLEIKNNKPYSIALTIKKGEIISQETDEINTQILLVAEDKDIQLNKYETKIFKIKCFLKAFSSKQIPVSTPTPKPEEDIDFNPRRSPIRIPTCPIEKL